MFFTQLYSLIHTKVVSEGDFNIYVDTDNEVLHLLLDPIGFVIVFNSLIVLTIPLTLFYHMASKLNI